ncbi:hypothetical protein A2392_01825 [Candidatus Kaiserbacteria bacterium RIFOXYB1_FULL_46_14]|uniref:Class F sortase n=1 Tax=Candidatus Kaiserbacteria bacterium RIFOXYB1_FULL_46_14 TaxID=1798531 RepID=A0A1F6FJZ4_9BACT|nr:MAG: hypothetical protein A2392_01825 [Candidatus Kaiserbacteria bacterium RIFOXYB1_FULL_46_14]
MFSFLRPIRKPIAVLLLGVLMGGSSTYFWLDQVGLAFGRTDYPEETSRSVEPSLPVFIRVLAVGIEAEFETPLDLDSTGLMEVPKGFDTVAWYKHSPTPGEIGPSVIVGHVDSETGPEVFQPLKDIKDGDLIEIGREDGSTAVFEVYRLSYHSKKRFPFEKVFGDVDGSELRLITCGGVFDHSDRSYSHNLVVYAKFLHWDQKESDQG